MKHILLFITLFFTTFLANGQGRESYQIAHDPTIDNPERYASYDCVYLLDSTDVTIQPNGSNSQIIRRIVKVMNKRGALAHRILRHSYNPMTSHAEFYRVTIYKANGDVFNLDITEQLHYTAPTSMFHQGSRQVLMEIGHLDSGDIIDYRINLHTLSTIPAITIQNKPFPTLPLLKEQPIHEIKPFESSLPIVRKVYKVNIPLEKGIQFSHIPETCTTSVRYEKEMKTYTFIRTDITPTQTPKAKRFSSKKAKVVCNNLAKTWTLRPDSSHTLRIQMELDYPNLMDSTEMFRKSLYIYNPQYQELIIHKAYLQQKDGTTHSISPKTFVECLPYEAIDAPDYLHLKEMVLFHPGIDSIKNIYLDYSIHTQATYQPELDIFEQLLQSFPVKRYTISITTPKEKPLSYTLGNYTVKPSVKRMKGMCTTQWVLSYLPAEQSVSTPKKPYLSATTYPTQADALATLSGQFDTAENMQLITIAESLLEDVEEEIDQIKTIHTYVLNHFDNNNLSLNHTAYRLRPTDQVISSAYGTEAEKANLLAALLNNAGFIAEPVVMYAVNNSKGLGLNGIYRLYVSCKVGKEIYLLSPTSSEMFKQTDTTFPLYNIHQGASL